MALTDRSIITLNQAKQVSLGIDVSDTIADDQIETIIDVQSGVIEDYIQQKVNLQSFEIFVDGTGKSLIEPPWWPINSLYGASDAIKLANVQYRDSTTDDWTTIADTIDQIHIPPKNPRVIELLDGLVFPYGTANIRLYYWAGHDPIPGPILNQMYERVAVAFRNLNPLGIGKSTVGLDSQGSSSVGGNSTTTFKDMEEKWRRELNPYRTRKLNVLLSR